MLTPILSAVLTMPALELRNALVKLGYSAILLLASLQFTGEIRDALLIAGSLGLFLTLFEREANNGVLKIGPLTVLRIDGKEYIIGFNALGLLALVPLFLL